VNNIDRHPIRSECFQDEGFPVTAEDLQQRPGISSAGLAEMIEERFGRPIPDGFMQAARAKIMDVFTQELRAIDGIAELLRSLTVPVCVASNSHTDRVRHSLQVTDLWQFFDPMCSARQSSDAENLRPISSSLPLGNSASRPENASWSKIVFMGSPLRWLLESKSSASAAVAIARPATRSDYSQPVATGYLRE
jgi:hypothetical protein